MYLSFIVVELPIFKTNSNFQAAIVGHRTKKVLFLGVRNKYCTLCARAEALQKDPSEHACFKNWNGTSTSMEADIIVEGFKNSMEMYGVKYTRFIADGDSCVYSKIQEAMPYHPDVVEKIECRNHIIRNYTGHLLKDVSMNTSCGTLAKRSVVRQKVRKLRTAVAMAVKHRSKEIEKPFSERVRNLREDILNGPSHVFGEHKNCASRGYFCDGPKDGEKNLVPFLNEDGCGVYKKLMAYVNNVANHSRSLIYDVDSNIVEQFNSSVAKVIGGKRINYSLKGSYQARCEAAVVVHNTRTFHSTLHKSMYGVSPGYRTKRMERTRNVKLKKAARRLVLSKEAGTWKPSKKVNQQSTVADKDYGPEAMKPDMDADTYELAKADFLLSLETTAAERESLERRTEGQSDSREWIEERRKRMTASRFGTVCKMRPSTSCENVVMGTIYNEGVNTAATRYGRDNEFVAIQQLEEEQKIKVTKCGLFIDPVLPYLAASPDGLIGKNAIVEVKCPSSAQHLTPAEAVEQKKIMFCVLSTDGTLKLKPNDNFMYQVQGQLHITRRETCLFVVWTPKEMSVEKVSRDLNFWETKMEPKLTKFYMNCLLPEIVDPRHRRQLEIRDPEYILEAQKVTGYVKKRKHKGVPSISKASKDQLPGVHSGTPRRGRKRQEKEA